MYMDDIKLFANSEKELETDTSNKDMIYCLDIRVEFT